MIASHPLLRARSATLFRNRFSLGHQAARRSDSSYNAASTIPVALKAFLFVMTTSTGYFHSMNFAQPAHRSTFSATLPLTKP